MSTPNARQMSILLINTALFCAFLMPSVVYAESKWEVITKEEGITVAKKSVPGLELPIIKGTGVVKAGLYDVLAVLSDTERNPEWMHSSRDARILKTVDDLERIIYTQVETPWPVDDRDVIVRSKVKIDNGKKRVMIHFNSIKSGLVKEKDGIVRMPMLKGFYRLDALGPSKTRVTYQAQAEVGGSIPNWLAELNSKAVPLETIRSLRVQVKKTTGQYGGFLKKWNPDLGGKGFPLE